MPNTFEQRAKKALESGDASFRPRGEANRTRFEKMKAEFAADLDKARASTKNIMAVTEEEMSRKRRKITELALVKRTCEECGEACPKIRCTECEKLRRWRIESAQKEEQREAERQAAMHQERINKLIETSMHLRSMPQFTPGQWVEHKITGEKLKVMPELHHPTYRVQNEQGREMILCSLECRPCIDPALENS